MVSIHRRTYADGVGASYLHATKLAVSVGLAKNYAKRLSLNSDSHGSLNKYKRLHKLSFSCTRLPKSPCYNYQHSRSQPLKIPALAASLASF